MNVKLLRSINIDLLLDQHNPIIDRFNSIWVNLHIVETNVYHKNGGELVYFRIDKMGKKEWIFYQDMLMNKFWCNYNRYWVILKADFNINYDEIQIITKLLVNNANCNLTTPPPSHTLDTLGAIDIIINNIDVPIPIFIQHDGFVNVIDTKINDI